MDRDYCNRPTLMLPASLWIDTINVHLWYKSLTPAKEQPKATCFSRELWKQTRIIGMANTEIYMSNRREEKLPFSIIGYSTVHPCRKANTSTPQAGLENFTCLYHKHLKLNMSKILLLIPSLKSPVIPTKLSHINKWHNHPPNL